MWHIKQTPGITEFISEDKIQQYSELTEHEEKKKTVKNPSNIPGFFAFCSVNFQHFKIVYTPNVINFNVEENA